MRKTIGCFLLILFMVSFASAQVPEHLKIKARGMGDAGILRARANGTAVFASANLRRVGGVMFQGELVDSTLVNSLKTVLLERSGNLGKLTFNLQNGKKVYYEAPYWLFIPAIKYGLSEDNAVVSLFGEPNEEELKKISAAAQKRTLLINGHNSDIETLKYCKEAESHGTLPKKCKIFIESFNEQYFVDRISEIDALEVQAMKEIEEYSKYFFFADVHPSLKGTSLGLRMLQADSLLIGASYVEVITVRGNLAKFPQEVGVSKEDTFKLNNSIALTMQQCSQASTHGIQAWILTDVTTNYSTTLVDSQIRINGLPYYYLWGSTEEDNIVEISECTKAFQSMRGEFAMRAPRTWNSAVHLARLSALIRTIKKKNPKVAQSLARISQQSDFMMSFPTPRAWPRNGYEDF